MEKNPIPKKINSQNFTGKSPLLFAIPTDLYSDGAEKERDKESFVKIQTLAKKCEQLKQKFNFYAQRHTMRIETTRRLALQTLEVNNRMRERKISY